MELRQRMKVLEVVQEILGEKPSSKSLEKLKKLMKILNAKENDTIIILLGIFEAYYSTLDRIPTDLLKLIEVETIKLYKNQQELQEGFATSLKEEITKSKKKEKVSTLSKWITASILFTTGILISTTYFLHDKVYKTAFESAYHKAYANYQFIDDWAKTEEAQQALRLAKNGQLSHFINCSAEGWEIEIINGRKVCIPTTGWYIEQ